MLQALCVVVAVALAIITVVLLVRSISSMVSVLRQGGPVSRTDNPGKRWATMLKETFGHTRMFQWRWVGVMHWFVYFGFIILASAVATGFVQLFDPKWQLPIIGHWFIFEWVCEVIGLLSTIGIVFLIVYRQLHKPEQLGRGSRFYGSRFWQAYFVEFMALLEGAAILFIRGAEEKYALLVEPDKASQSTNFHFPIAHLLGGMYGDSESALKNTILVIALIKVASALVWLDVIALNLTMGIAWHRFTAWVNIWFKRESVGRATDGATTALGRMKPMTIDGKPVTLDDVENDRIPEDAVLGVGKIEDFSWKGILDFTTCTECGRCQSQCPAWNTEKPLSPKLLVMDLREQAYAGHAARLASEVPIEVPYAKLAGAEEAPLVDFDVLWSCTSCGACVQQCPVDIEHVDHIMDMRRYQVLVESNFPTELNGLFRGLEGKGNPWNMSATQRLDWAKDLDFEVKVVGEDIESLDEVDWLFWVGCAGAYEDRAKKTTRAVAELLNIAGISFGVLGNGETCTGDPARRAGNEFVFQGLAQQNVETFKEFKVKKAVTTCAHCFNTLKNEYKELGIELEVVHHTQLLNKLVREGKLTPVPSGAGAHKRSITYHDPCYIGRHNGVYTPPRELLQVLPGAEYVEMERNSERSFCCGAGGARMWMEERIGQRINRNRTDEAVGTGADQIATGCPFCRIMLSDGLTAAQADGTAREEVEVLDVAQMLLASVKGEQATKLLPGESAGSAPAPAQAERTVAEPGQDTTTSAPADTTEPVTVPDDASSLFDTPAPAEPAAPAAPAQPEKPAEPSGGSLFDTPAPEPAKPAEPAPAAEPEPAAEAAPAPAPAASSGTASTPRTDVDIDSVSSLFDIDAPEGAVAAAAAPAAPAAPAPAPAEKPAAEAPAPAVEEAEPEAEPEAKAEPTPAPAPAAPAPAAPATSSGTSSEPRRDVDIAAVSSLFDIDAPSGSVAAAPAPAPAAPAPAAEAPAQEEAPAEEPAAEPEPEAKAEPTPTPAPATPAPAAPAAASGTSSEPRRDVDIAAVSSLFDIDAPSGSVAAAPAPAAPAPAPEAPAQEAPAEVVEEAEPEPEPEAKAEPEPSSAPAQPAPATPAPSSGATNEPRRDVDITSLGSLFDI